MRIEGTVSIVHAAGVYAVRQKEATGGWEGCDALAQMAEVLGTNGKTQDLINHMCEVSQGANDCERWSIGGAQQTARGG
ncbi:MAG: hypothetical protein ABSF15_18575 [Candidatus Sulfotelmatobacter sp.]